MTDTTTLTFTLLELGTLDLALEAYVDDLVDTRHHAEDRAAVEARGEDTSEYDELDVEIAEATAVWDRIREAYAKG